MFPFPQVSSSFQRFINSGVLSLVGMNGQKSTHTHPWSQQPGNWGVASMWWSFRSPELSDLKQSSDVFVATQTIMNSQQEGCEKRLWLRLNISPWRNKNVRLFPLPSMLWLLLAVISRWGRDLQIGYPILTVGKCWSSILNLPFYGYYIYICICIYNTGWWFQPLWKY